MNCFRLFIFLSAFFCSGLAFAIPNVWVSGFGQGWQVYHINNKKITLRIDCNYGYAPDAEHGLSLEDSKGVDLFTKPNHTLSFLINGKAFEFDTNKSGKVVSSYRNAANDWRDFIETIQKARKIEVYYDDKKIVEYNPKNVNSKDMEGMTESCSPLFYREAEDDLEDFREAARQAV